jgi:DNA-binding LytR/AlgR family response regulator
MKSEMEHGTDERISLSIQGRLLVFSPRDLIVIEGHKGGCRFHFENDQIVNSSRSTGYYFEMIKRCQLIQVHRSYFINLLKIQEYNRSDEIIMMINNIRIPLGRKFKPELVTKLKALNME